MFVDTAKKIVRKIPFLYLFLKGIVSLLTNGFAVTFMKVKSYFLTKKKIKKKFKKNFTVKDLLTQKDANKERNTKFSKNIKFSILVPLYNTPSQYLKEMLDSVIFQTYQNWELCLADGSDSSHELVRQICESYAKKDLRIKYRKLEKNHGISENTNCCLDMAVGDYMVLLDHDDLLHPSALYEVALAVCEKNADFIYTDETTFNVNPSDAFNPHFKPNFSPDNLRSINYICHLTVFKASLLEKSGRFRSEFDGAQDHDLVLRLTENAEKIVHIPKILYYWRAHPSSTAYSAETKSYTYEAGKNAIAAHLDRVGLKGTVENTRIKNMYRIRYEIKGEPLISILIPNKDHIKDLEKCLRSVFELSTYKNYEIIIIENNSAEEKTFSYYEKLKNRKNIKIVHWNGVFNYSAINNFGARYANGEYLLLLNNDTKIITPCWLQEMLMFAQRTDVGAVGAKLYYPDNTVQHAGVILGLGGVAGHSHKNFPRAHYGYMKRLLHAQNLSCVTGACLMIRKKVFTEVGGLDERFRVAFNDVDLCMRVQKSGYRIVFAPFAELYHYESKSRGFENTSEKKERFIGEIQLFRKIWGKELKDGDPYYNPNLTLDREDFSPIE